MKNSRKGLLIVVGMLICLGCAGTRTTVQENNPPQNEGEQKLYAGIKSYEEGNYKESVTLLQKALTEGLTDTDDQVEAHKYLAFIHCVSGRTKECIDEFKKVFELDPNFELQAAEVGHPIWGPVYKSVKGEKETPTAASAKPPAKKAATPPADTIPKDVQSKESPPPQAPSAKTLVVIKTSNLRENADGKSKIIRILKKGEKVEYLGHSKSGDWIQCKLPSGMKGWIFKDLVQETPHP